MRGSSDSDINNWAPEQGFFDFFGHLPSLPKKLSGDLGVEVIKISKPLWEAGGGLSEPEEGGQRENTAHRIN